MKCQDGAPYIVASGRLCIAAQDHIPGTGPFACRIEHIAGEPDGFRFSDDGDQAADLDPTLVQARLVLAKLFYTEGNLSQALAMAEPPPTAPAMSDMPEATRFRDMKMVL